MLADAEGIDADLVGQHALVDDIADDLGVRQRLAVRADRDIANSAGGRRTIVRNRPFGKRKA